MSKRRTLEDSDSDDDTSPPAPAADNSGGSFFTSDEQRAIDRCNIQKLTLMDNVPGKYSNKLHSEAVARLEEHPVEIHEGKHRVKKGEEKAFFDRDVYLVHGKSGNEFDISPSEEAILLEIDAVRRSEKSIKNRMFKQKETGGMVIFGPWWNYALQRIMELHAVVDPASLGEYTSVKIMRSLFEFITEDLLIVKPGNLPKMKSSFGIDWTENVKIARKVIDHCGPSHPLDKELAAVEAHVQGLQGGKKTSSAAKPSAAAGSPKKKSAAKDEAAAAKKKKDARQKRLDAMRASSLKRAPSLPIGESAPAPVPVPPPAPAPVPPPAGSSASMSSAPAPAPSAGSFAAMATPAGSFAGMADRSLEPQPGPSAGYGQGGNDMHGDRKSPPEHISSASPAQPARAAPVQPARDDGWGRKRDGGDASRPNKAKGSWEFARRSLSHNIQVDPRYDTQPPPGQNVSRAGEPERPTAGQGSYASRDDYGRAQGSGRDYDDRRDDRRDVARSVSNNNRGSDGGGGRDSDRRGGEQEEYSRSSSSRGGGARDEHHRDEYRPSASSRGYERSGSQEEYHSSHGQGSGGTGSGYSQGAKHSRGFDDREERPQKRYRGANETRSTPAISTGASRGRGAHVNKPAWMTQQENGSGPAGMPSNDNGSSNAGSSTGRLANYPATSLGSSVAPSAPSNGAGRGRGEHVNKPAWMTQQEQGSGPTSVPSNYGSSNPTSMGSYTASSGSSTAAGAGRGPHVNRPAWLTQQEQNPTQNGYTGMPSNNIRSNNAPSAPTGAGRGRGVHMNKPAWMTQQEQNPTQTTQDNGASSTISQQPPQVNANHRVNAVGELPSNGRGRGAGRGRGRGSHVNKPAWMTQQEQNP